MSADIGLVGMGPMGKNLAINFHTKGFSVAVHNRTHSKAEAAANEVNSPNFRAYKDVADFVAALRPPRVVILLVQADVVDSVGEAIAAKLSRDDILIDSGNSLYKLTETRRDHFRERFGVHFYGIGISGGEEGALKGPAIMVGGDRESAHGRLLPLLERVCALPQVAGADNRRCIAYCGAGGAGHMVKMVHNGCEYGIMQLIAEACVLLRSALGLTAAQAGDVFSSAGAHEGAYLFENVAQVLRKKEGADCLIDKVKDIARQKGTGRWTSVEALNHGVPTSIIDAGVLARTFSEQRHHISLADDGSCSGKVDLKEGDVIDALMAGVVLTFQQSMDLIVAISNRMGYETDLAEVLQAWRGGCIIRMNFLTELATYYRSAAAGALLIEAPFIRERYLNTKTIESLRRVVGLGLHRGIPMPAFTAVVTYVDLLRTDRLATAYIQGMRDNFGAHTFERIDKPGTHHADWSE
ncbi:6-phosphogluconate dehydrogenase, decarboxylating [Giardia muris]|uniref:6-phosphogluconate dehydrogenase, decarboxylating n=1 Tax=Giardia muris TaxID=5742 RepID=A0A4Z1T3G0_GIAMU|nr:6-phosphogluconate dehydrogenase, decarboxylating [Giardia muris]|eukprot:TNJ26941.1 6-phosphogluconate dehydrogenase, decarboxylating [Giardia muris]